MTPDKARELLENATAGPWEYKDYTVYMNACRDVLTIPDGVYGVIQEQDGPLVAAAPDLAELVAGMHYEYAAQVEHDGRKKTVTDSDGGLWLCGHINSEMQHWHRDRKDAQEYADCWDSHYSKSTGATARVVRRLVSEEEVVS